MISHTPIVGFSFVFCLVFVFVATCNLGLKPHISDLDLEIRHSLHR